MSQTLAIIKPDAIASGKAGAILAHLEREGVQFRSLKMTRLNRAQAEAFYGMHRTRPFFESLVSFMTSGPVVPMVLEADGAVQRLREMIGATDPVESAEGTIRSLFAESTERNAIHASDSDATAAREIAFFFSESALLEL